MGFSNEQVEALKAPLNRSNVKERKQAGRTLSYVEGWHAIAEANRIFGFDAWTRETVDLRVVAESPRKIGQPPRERDGFGVTYVARVRIVVNGIVREGVGAGHGIDVDLGLAHESAIKEAETDAMKRGLMTFGNPFGLALYDKAQANVADAPSEPDSRDIFVEGCWSFIKQATDAAALAAWWQSDEQRRLRDSFQLSQQEVEALKREVMARRSAITGLRGAA